MSRRTYIALIAALTIIAAVRVASTHRILSTTTDEPVHLAGGWMWLEDNYTIDMQHPPLARVLCALPLRMAGLPDPPPGPDADRGNFLLYHGDRYLKNLARARIGNLVLLIVAILAVAAQARRLFGRGVAVMAALLFSNVPSVLAHAGVITTDMAVTAAIPLALLALDVFLEAPSRKRAAMLGAAIGVGLLAKFSFVLYFPAAAAVLFVLRRRSAPRESGGRAALHFAIVVAAAFLVWWAGYRFDFKPAGKVFYGASFFVEHAVPEPIRAKVRWISDHVPVPAPAWFVGMSILALHDKEGHLTYLLGETSMKGWWHYFPVVFFFKTPLPFLLLAAAGIFFVIRDRRGIEHAFIPLAILLVAMTGSINIGIRHILPMYASLAIVAGYATVELWRRARGPFHILGMSAMMAWLFIAPAMQHPDYLAYFNEAAGRKPWLIVADSNLDWGQDVVRLEKAMRELNIDRVWIRYSTGSEIEKHGIKTDPLPDHPVSGWIVVGETPFSLWRERMTWLEQYEPVRRIGKSMRLYYVRP